MRCSATSTCPRRARPSASGTRRTGSPTTPTSSRYHTTTALTPAEIHEIGLKEVARNRAEMQKVMDEVGFKGSLTDFFQFLRTDPKFYYKTGDELFRAYAYITKMIDPELPRLFGKLYRTPFGLRAIPENSAPNTTTAYYQPPVDRRLAAGLLLREPLPPRSPAEVGDGSADGARGGAGPSPADRARPGADRPADVPPRRRLHGLRRGLGTLFGAPRLRHRALQGSVFALRPAHL